MDIFENIGAESQLAATAFNNLGDVLGIQVRGYAMSRALQEKVQAVGV